MKQFQTIIRRELEAARRTTEHELEQIKKALTIMGGGNLEKRHLSASARARISRAQKARWAIWHKKQRRAA